MNNKELTELKSIEETWSPSDIGGKDIKRDFIARCHVEVSGGGFLRFPIAGNKRGSTWLDERLMAEFVESLVTKNTQSNDEIKREVGHCRLCNKETYCVYNINLKAISICESCGRAIAKQELDDMFQAQKENNE